MRRFIYALLIVTLVPYLPSAFAASSVKSGTACPKVGQKKTTTAGTYVCTKSGKKSIWVLKTRPVVRPPTVVPPVVIPTSPEGQSCSGHLDRAEFQGKQFACREIAGSQFRFFEIEQTWQDAKNPASPNNFTDCRLPDMRSKKTAVDLAVTYPSRPRQGSSKSGVHKIAVVGLDFNDVPGIGDPIGLFDDDFERSANFVNWYSEGRATLEFSTHHEWIRLAHPSSAYKTDEHFGPLGQLSLREMANEIYETVGTKMDLRGYSMIWFLYPPNAVNVTNNFGAASGWTKIAIYGLGKRAFDQKLPMWTYFMHEFLHEQGLAGHSPKEPWVFGVLFNGNGLTSGMNSWDQITNDWASNDSIYCVEKSFLQPSTLQLAPIERRQAGTHSIMVKLDDHRALVIESHRRGEFSPGMPDALYGLTLQLVDTSVDTTWDSEEATSSYVRIGRHARYPNPGIALPEYPGVTIWNNKGFMGGAWGWTTDWLLLQGETVEVEGIIVEFMQSGSVDTVKISPKL